MKIPKQITILGRKIKVKEIPVQKLHEMYPNALGMCDSYNDLIYIAKELPAKAKVRVFRHECVHAFLDIVGIDQVLNENENEIYAQCISAFIESMSKY